MLFAASEVLHLLLIVVHFPCTVIIAIVVPFVLLLCRSSLSIAAAIAIVFAPTALLVVVALVLGMPVHTRTILLVLFVF